MPESISELTRIVFIKPDYALYAVIIGAVVFALLMVNFFRTMILYGHYGGYNKCRRAAKASGGNITGRFGLIAKAVLMSLIIMLIGLTLAVPVIKEPRDENEYEPALIAIVLDRTISMLAEDVKPSRLEAAKETILKLIQRIKEEGGKDKIALLGMTDITVPLVDVPTDDYGEIENHILVHDFSEIKKFETHGTNVWDSIEWGINSLTAEKNNLVKILIVISDGEQVAEDDYVNSTRKKAEETANKNSEIKIFIIGIGTSEEEPYIPNKKSRTGEVLEYYVQETGPNKGMLVSTRPSPAYLGEISATVGGEFTLSETRNELSEKLNDILTKERRIIGKKAGAGFKNMSPFFIVMSLALMLFVPFAKLE